MIFGTRESTKKHDFVARGKAPKSTIFGTKESTKKHDLEYDFLHEGKHDFWHEGKTLKTTFAQNGRSIKKSLFWLIYSY